MLDSIDYTPDNADACVIWCHGLGADGHDFYSIAPLLQLESHAIRFVFPHAPVMPVTINAGYQMPAWFDILSLTNRSRQDTPGILKARQMINELIEHEIDNGFDPARIFLAGFSQGGALALFAGLSFAKPLAGIIALSCYLPLAETLLDEARDANQNTPIFMAHGSQDEVVVPQLGEVSRDILLNNQYKLDWHTYPMGHAVCDEEMLAIKQWLENQFQ